MNKVMDPETLKLRTSVLDVMVAGFKFINAIDEMKKDKQVYRGKAKSLSNSLLNHLIAGFNQELRVSYKEGLQAADFQILVDSLETCIKKAGIEYHQQTRKALEDLVGDYTEITATSIYERLDSFLEKLEA